MIVYTTLEASFMVVTKKLFDKTTAIIPVFMSYQNKLIDGGYVKVNRAFFRNNSNYLI